MKASYTVVIILVALGISLGGCGPTMTEGDEEGNKPSADDSDGDGYNRDVDCNDDVDTINPGAEETCNGFDDDCSGHVDDPFDTDGDNYSTCMGDCNDGDASINPGATEVANDKDDDCNDAVDDNLSTTDDDGDGYSEADGDCDDNETFVNPGAVEVATTAAGDPEGVDNDCDGAIDEAFEPCDSGLDESPESFAKAMELCSGVTSSTFNASASAAARAILGAFGSVYVPRFGSEMITLSSGKAAAGGNRDPGTAFTNMDGHPDPQPDPADGCGMADPATVNDYTELTLNITVPSNAKSFAFDFNFMTAEYPEYVCTSFDDTFVAYLESSMFTGNISFDSMGRPVTVNVGFFTVCAAGSGSAGCAGAGDLAGTGYDVNGGTGWLTTTAPVAPGEHIRLTFSIFDEGDRVLDSSVLIDNFRWLGEAVDDPITIDRVVGSLMPVSYAATK